MTAPFPPCQFELFETLPEQARKRNGKGRHEPTPELVAFASKMSAAGQKRSMIARAMRIGLSTFDRHYSASLPSKFPIGRPRHSPTPATRTAVGRAYIAGMPLVGIAKLIGISVPTLQLHYPDQLQA